MAFIGVAVIYVVMACAVIGAVASLIDPEKGIGKEFLDGLHAIGYIFVPVAGIMALVPYLSAVIAAVVGPRFAAVGADPAMAATTFLAVDMGGYQLAKALAGSRHEGWIMAMVTGYMAGATIVFSIPVGLSMLEKKDHPYMALGVMSGLLSVPVGVLVSGLLMVALSPEIRSTVDAKAADYALRLTVPTVFANVAPLAAVMAVLALGLRLAPERMIRGFMLFGRVMTDLITLALVAAIVEHYTRTPDAGGILTRLLGRFDLAPVVADEEDQVRALEVAGYIGMMLAGAFPMVYLLRKYLDRPVAVVGKRLGLEAAGAAGLLAAVANILAMFRLVRDMKAKDKVLCIAFSVCAAFLLGDHLAFTANFQPTLLLPVLAGKFSGGLFAIALAHRLSVPAALRLEHDAELADIKALAESLPALAGQDVTVTALGGGMTNRNYRVTTASGVSYVLRVSGAGTEELGIDRAQEAACALAAAAAVVGPEVVAHYPEIHVTLTVFLPGRTLKDADVRDANVLRRVGATLRRLHDYPAPPGIKTFSPFEVARSYVERAKAKQVPLPVGVDEALAFAACIEGELGAGEACLCHNDLLPGNLIDNGEIVKIIDWEYASLGDRFFDLGNLAVNCQLDEAGERLLLEADRGSASDADLRRLQLMRLASDLREATWGFLQAGTSKIHPPAFYLDYGGRHLKRFLDGARAMGVN